MKKETALTLFFILLAAAGLHAQRSGSSLFKDPVYLPERFYTTFSNDLPIYNGRLYQGYLPTIAGTPFMDADQWTEGTVFFDSTWYKNTRLKYDVVAGELVIETPGKMPVILPANPLYAFTLGQERFIKLGPGNSKVLPAGFYEILDEGRLTVLALRKKIIKETTGQSVVEREFIWNNRFYIYQNNLFYPVTSKKNLYALTKEKKAAIHKALKRKQIRFRKDPETAIRTAAQLYNQD
ncbi:hypothetical protein [Niabella hirudinis]|uniref:hypothetical protein n=1 Tax=Niabella hirudinis TaxID=1285929 RepID=UPI003EBCBF07